MYGEQVTWTFRKVLHVFELDDTPFETGKELYARFLHVKKTESVDTVVKHHYPELIKAHSYRCELSYSYLFESLNWIR